MATLGWSDLIVEDCDMQHWLVG